VSETLRERLQVKKVRRKMIMLCAPPAPHPRTAIISNKKLFGFSIKNKKGKETSAKRIVPESNTSSFLSLPSCEIAREGQRMMNY